jgi:uncharacterized protein YdeI (YjbR/CyaY-like superfamily)
MLEPTNLHKFEHRAQWRRWLEKHHALESEAWLMIFKKKYRDLGLSLEDAIEEALCFGWIDGKLKSIDEKRYMLRFSPRTSNSIWSMSNIHRVEKLIAGGKMTKDGQRKINEAQENGEWEAAIRRERVDLIPQDLERELQKTEGALSSYQALPDSRKKQYIYWLQSAKREETKQRRIKKIVEEILNRLAAEN